MLLATVDGITVYDPRDDSWKVSDNPALVLGHLVTQKHGAVVGEGFWPGIAKLADFCEVKGDEEPVP
jgi:hypothetical protein